MPHKMGNTTTKSTKRQLCGGGVASPRSSKTAGGNLLVGSGGRTEGVGEELTNGLVGGSCGYNSANQSPA